MTFSFNYIFEPFNVEYSEHKMSFIWVSIIHSVTPVFVLFLIYLLNEMFKFDVKWNIIKEVFLIIIFFLVVGVIQFLIRDFIYDNANNWSWEYFYEEVKNTFSVGILFLVILLPLNFTRLKKKHVNSATVIDRVIGEKEYLNEEKKAKVKIQGLEFEINEFVFAKSEGNYLEIYLNNENLKKTLIRATLKSLEIVLQKYPSVIKTHRSFIVNSKYIEKIEGNAQGYQLYINNNVVPVSRNMIEFFNQKMEQI